MSIGNLNEARADLEVALRINPGDQWARDQLEYVREQIDRALSASQSVANNSRRQGMPENVIPMKPDYSNNAESEQMNNQQRQKGLNSQGYDTGYLS